MMLKNVLVQGVLVFVLAGCTCDHNSRAMTDGKPSRASGRGHPFDEENNGALCSDILQTTTLKADNVEYTINVYNGMQAEKPAGTPSPGPRKPVQVVVVMGQIDGATIPFPDGYSGNSIPLDPHSNPYSKSEGLIKINTGFAWVHVESTDHGVCEEGTPGPKAGRRWKHVATRTLAGGAQGTDFIFACVPDNGTTSKAFDRVFLLSNGSTSPGPLCVDLKSETDPKQLEEEGWQQADINGLGASDTTFKAQDCAFIKGVVAFVKKNATPIVHQTSKCP